MKKIISYPFPRRLKSLRLAKDYSQEEVGIKAGFSPNSCSTRMNIYELGKHEADYNSIKKIADVFKIDPAYFYADSEIVAEFIKKWSEQNLHKN